jgi:tripartite-type tricarboxylate transporter receptor subunit TctC
MKPRLRLFGLLAVLGGLLAPLGASAQGAADNYPSRAVRFIVSIGPGSSADTMTRAFAEQFSKVAGVPTFVENKPGADLIIGTQALLNSPPDGYSLVLISPTPMILNPLFVKDLPYSPSDLMPILNFSRHVTAVVTGPDSRFKTLQELIEAARKEPGSVSVGVYGSSYRLGAADLAKRAGVRFNVVPYKGASQAMTDAAGGSVDAVLVDVAGAAPLVTGGKLRALATAGEKRHPLLPDVPTVQESGVPGFTLDVFIGLGIHGKTPAPIADKLEALMQQTMKDPALREKMAQSGGIISGEGRQKFSEYIAVETARMRELARTSDFNQ